MDQELLDRIQAASKTQIMGIFNATPDSFYDGGKYKGAASAAERLHEMAVEGADILDLGAESSRPGAGQVSVQEEVCRLQPVLEAALGTGLPVSVDTCKSDVARFALERGAAIINDISAFSLDPEMGRVVAEHNALCVLMHMQGTPRTMQTSPQYDDVVDEVYSYLGRRAEYAISQGVSENAIWVDPGFGFGKTLEHNLELMRRLDEFQRLGFPILIGTSNKSMIGAVLGAPPEERLEGTAATVAIGVLKGVHCLRVHDVKAMARVARMCDAILGKS